jgi:hypothetical protein
MLEDMKQQDEKVYTSSAPRNSIAGRSKEELAAEADNARHSSLDPLAAKGILQEENIPNFVPGKPLPGIKITGEADPIFAKAGFAIGDRVYHKLKKLEGTIIDLMASGKVIVKLDDGRKGTMQSSNIVKL